MKLCGVFLFLLWGSGASGQSGPAGERPATVRLGTLTLKPSGFLDLLGTSRSRATGDSVSSRLGNAPLQNRPGETLWSARHSRLMLKGDLPAGLVRFSAYLEGDFMNSGAARTPYRWRQYWGEMQAGAWRFLAGRAQSLLRPNRAGTASDRDLMNTDVADPGYHVGLLGSRVRQIRLTWVSERWQAAAAWEAGGNRVAKIALDRGPAHLEFGGLVGPLGRRGISAAAVRKVGSRLRLVTQQYWSRRAASVALGVAPAGVGGVSTLEGVEVPLSREIEIYSYAGLVYAECASRSGNRVVRQWTAGVNRRWNAPGLPGAVLLSFQYSHLDRAVWDGRTGVMDFVIYRFRYSLN